MSPEASRKAITYAEVRLGVHDVHQEAITARNGLDECLTRMAELRDSRRTWEATMLDREMELSADERGKHADASDAWLGRHLKVVFHNDSVLTDARHQLNAIVSDLEGTEYDRSVIEADLKIAVARMTELGGYLQYLAAVKLSTNIITAP